MIITKAELASYLRTAEDPEMNLIVDLANGIVGELPGVTYSTPVPSRVKAITLEVAARAWRNPNGYSSETVDDYTYRRDADTRAAGVYLTDTERSELIGLGGAVIRRAGTIAMTSPWDVA